ncbi:unnamed protein product [Rhizoctonia solani]|uniref:Uncharacterized protein n=1 Tax=Rhizoctonia solani TaxID=456999 RepID=A0A8H2WTT4_9AGAM|nr:unnamed protein product [Rhizoctonia solani]
MSSSATFTLPPINAGDVFTCQGTGLLYENIARVPVEELRELLSGGSGQTLAGDRKESKKWFQAQCGHYGLSTKGIVATLRSQLNALIASPTAGVPEEIVKLEAEKNDEYKALSEQIKTITSRARSPTPGRTRRVTMASPATPSSQGSPSTKSPRWRTISAGASSTARTPDTDPETQPQPVKRGRGRPRKSEPAPTVDLTNTAETSTTPKPDKGKGVTTITNSKPSRPEPPSQTGSAISTYSELDDEVMDALDDIEEGFEFMEKDLDGDSQMNSLSSPPRPPVSLPEPRTPRRAQLINVSTPHGNSPRSTMERDVVSGAWSLRIVSASKQPCLNGQQVADLKGGTMNLHLAEDKRSLVGEFSLMGMDGVLQSRTLEGRIDGAYARLLFVGQVAVDDSQTSNKVFGPSTSQRGYLRFTDGRKSNDGKFTFKGALQGGNFGIVDFEGVREGEEQPLCVAWDDFVD